MQMFVGGSSPSGTSKLGWKTFDRPRSTSEGGQVTLELLGTGGSLSLHGLIGPGWMTRKRGRRKVNVILRALRRATGRRISRRRTRRGR